MAQFVARHDTALSVSAAWERITDWPRHARYVPFTTITVPTAGPNGLGTVFVARTGLGRWAFDDPMEVVEWVSPDGRQPGRCRLVKRGAVMLGWAELAVEAGPQGTRATWTEEITLARLPRLSDAVTARSARFVFSRVLRRILDDG